MEKNIIIRTLSPIITDVYPNIYNGSNDKYITYNYTNSKGENFADDIPQDEEVSLQIHIFCKENPKKYVKAARKALFEADFTYPEVTMSQYEDDTNLNHVTLECSYLTNTDL